VAKGLEEQAGYEPQDAYTAGEPDKGLTNWARRKDSRQVKAAIKACGAASP
jgi:hypothetical protein